MARDKGPAVDLTLAALKAKCAVGERKNYNFQGSDYTYWPFATIEQLPEEHGYKYKARAIVVDASEDTYHVVFNSYHQDYGDAERAIAAVRESLTGDGPLYNIFAETIETHSHTSAGKLITVCETLALIWSFQYST
jgi:hypothetical protein